jgi:hypothetical protein
MMTVATVRYNVLPLELFVKIGHHLGVKNFGSFVCICHQFSTYNKMEGFWQKLATTYFLKLPPEPDGGWKKGFKNGFECNGQITDLFEQVFWLDQLKSNNLQKLTDNLTIKVTAVIPVSKTEEIRCYTSPLSISRLGDEDDLTPNPSWALLKDPNYWHFTVKETYSVVVTNIQVIEPDSEVTT